MMLLTVLLLFVFLPSCATDEDPETSETEGEENVQQDWYDAFETVDVLEEEYELKRIAESGTVVDIIDSERILSIEDNRLLLINHESQSEEVIEEEAWNPYVSIDKNAVFYETDDGIFRFKLESEEKDRIYSKQGSEIIRHYIATPDGKQVFLQIIDDENIYRSYHLSNEGDVREISIEENQEFQVIRPLYLTPYRLYALAEFTQSVVQGDAEVVKQSKIDFVYFQLANGEMQNLTSNSIDRSTYFLDTTEQGNIILETRREEQKEDGVELIRDHIIFNINTEYYASAEIHNEDVYLYKSVDGQNRYVTIQDPPELDYEYPDKVDIVRTESGEQKVIGTILTGAPSEAYLHDNQMVFQSHGDVYLIEKKE